MLERQRESIKEKKGNNQRRINGKGRKEGEGE